MHHSHPVEWILVLALTIDILSDCVSEDTPMLFFMVSKMISCSHFDEQNEQYKLI